MSPAPTITNPLRAEVNRGGSRRRLAHRVVAEPLCAGTACVSAEDFADTAKAAADALKSLRT